MYLTFALSAMKRVHMLKFRRINANQILKIAASYINIRCSSSINKDIYHNGPRRFNPLQKIRFRDDKETRVASRICFTIMGNGSIGQPRCVALFTMVLKSYGNDTKGFLFNCGEGIGRLCREYEINIGQLRHVFITQMNWKNMSGLPDIYLTNEMLDVRKMKLYGPPGIKLFTSMISSVRMDTSLSLRESYSDENLEISYIPVMSSSSAVNQGTSLKTNSNKGRESDVSFNYVCKINGKLGEFNPEKCVDQGVPFGPHLLKLKNGEDVILPSGKLIHSSDVLDAAQPPMTFLVVDCPSENFLDAFVCESQFSEYQLPADCASEVAGVFHYSPDHIIKSTKYQEWMQKFHQNTEHYILNSSSPSISSGAVRHTQNILHLLHPEIFKILPEKEKADHLLLPISSKIIYPPPMLQIHIRPEKKINWCDEVSNDFDEYIQMVKNDSNFIHELEKLESLTSLHPSSDGRNEYPEVLFLGTGSATSSIYRNVSAILVNLNSHKSVLLDCGENTVMQLARYYGVSELDAVLRKISCVFITHKHTDHYLGLFEFIKARIDAFENSGLQHKTLALILPSQINTILGRFCDIFGSLRSKVRVYACSHLTAENGYNEKLKTYLGDVKLETVPVKHCPDAYGVVLQLHTQWKIVYSGDTAPCQKLIDAGENCNLLIHEASIEDNLLTEATMKKHSTPSQVVDISERMNAQYTIMTHFSKRYLAVPVFQEHNHRHIAVAFDFMKVRMNELPLLPYFLPALKCLFKQELDNFLEKSSTVLSSENVFLKTYRSFKTKNKMSLKTS